ncbi:MAG: putative photosynthetic complex assembly protein PuhE [Sphingomonadaceae bacterium]
MGDLLLAALFVTLVWFFATGGILWLNRLPRELHQGAIVAAIPAAAAAFCAHLVAAHETGPAAAYLAFGAAIILWGWHEMSFLMGFVTGPNRADLQPGLRGWQRFRASAATLIHHEIALALTLLAMTVLTWGAPNQVGTLTFALLFAMRLSTKLNIFLGVSNLSSELLPPHLAYLRSHFRQAHMNPLFPVSLLVSTALLIHLGARAGSDTGAALLFTLAFLGVIEHLFMMLPVRDADLWKWAAPALQLHQADDKQREGNPNGL